MLINLSNHPYEKWDEKQKQAALVQFGVVEDFPFPLISPNADLSDIEKLAEQIFNEINEMHSTDMSVHLMGEYVLCYQLTKRFEIKKIPCYASTTQRKVIMSPNGEKISLFQFIKFRPYYSFL